MDFAEAIDTAAFQPGLFDQSGQPLVILCLATQWRAQPDMEAAMMYQEHAAHHAHPEQAPVRFFGSILAQYDAS